MSDPSVSSARAGEGEEREGSVVDILVEFSEVPKPSRGPDVGGDLG
ncbi:hypothetical protein [Methanoculleus sp. 10]|nr:hypothetical protein [Methanoculleus sp. 10]MBP7299536.1 hypothetical protein [Methanoculleus sp.]